MDGLDSAGFSRAAAGSSDGRTKGVHRTPYGAALTVASAVSFTVAPGRLIPLPGWDVTKADVLDKYQDEGVLIA